jgi:hypothetical protein
MEGANPMVVGINVGISILSYRDFDVKSVAYFVIAPPPLAPSQHCRRLKFEDRLPFVSVGNKSPLGALDDHGVPNPGAAEG